MKISCNWLLKYIETDLEPQKIAGLLTGIGLEVEELYQYSTSPRGIDNLVVGHIVELEQHPNADKLKLTKVDVGGPELLNIVCGAPNVAAGQKVIVAQEGVTLYPSKGEPFTIKKSKIRGAYSEGMLCAEDEIGLGESHEGLLIMDENAEIGSALTNYIKGYNDWILEIGLTPNRVDAASHIGVARDLAAILGLKLKYPLTDVALQHVEQLIDIEIENQEDCPRYSGLVIRGIEVKDSPEWLQDYLKAIGLNPINNIVDATNFVLHEYGHPLHAFDLDTIEGKKIIVKRAVPGTKFTTLDKQERELDGSELMICNAREPVALAGIFGGLYSGITPGTRDIFIESAYFNPSVVRRGARRHQLFTDASFRFERGADPNITLKALGRVAGLIQEIAGGTIIGPVYDEYPVPIVPVSLQFDFDYLNSVAGTSIPKDEVKGILSGLEFVIQGEDARSLHIEIPTFKTDVKRPIDVVEEVMRIWSFDNVPMPAQIRSVVQVDKLGHSEKLRKRISAFLIDRGFFETSMLSFVKPEENQVFPLKNPVKVLNPISADLAEIRNNMLAPGLKVLQHNLNRRQPDVLIFNWDNIHNGAPGALKQDYRLSIWMCGNLQPGNWYQEARKADIYVLKSLVQQVMKLANRDDYEEGVLNETHFSEGMSFTAATDKTVAVFGKLDNRLLKKFDISQDVYYADIDAKWLLKAHGSPLKYDPVSKFPGMERDLSLVLPENLSYADIRNLIQKTDNRILKKVSIFDVYKGGNLGDGLKSYAIRMEFEDKTQTLEDKTVDKLVQKIIYRLENELQAKIRS